MSIEEDPEGHEVEALEGVVSSSGRDRLPCARARAGSPECAR
jgi:hypothetical protein